MKRGKKRILLKITCDERILTIIDACFLLCIAYKMQTRALKSSTQQLNRFSFFLSHCIKHNFSVCSQQFRQKKSLYLFMYFFFSISSSKRIEWTTTTATSNDNKTKINRFFFLHAIIIWVREFYQINGSVNYWRFASTRIDFHFVCWFGWVWLSPPQLQMKHSSHSTVITHFYDLWAIG